jgi:two-component system, OmpR family, alkaline phosphatase synthesis response regulator PhoP
MAKAKVLVVDDEKDLIELVRYNLEKEGFQVTSALDGETGFAIAVQSMPDIVLIDLMLPGIDGLEVCSRLRKSERTARIPIIMLTAKSGESDRVVGLEMGADDYVTKPFSPRELAARVKAVLRRTGAAAPGGIPVRRGGLTIDPVRCEVSSDGKQVSLTATEFKLLQFLTAHPGRVFSRGEIIDGVLGKELLVLDRTVDVHVMSLRRKLGQCGESIETVRGFGYRFCESEA